MGDASAKFQQNRSGKSCHIKEALRLVMAMAIGLVMVLRIRTAHTIREYSSTQYHMEANLNIQRQSIMGTQAAMDSTGIRTASSNT